MKYTLLFSTAVLLTGCIRPVDSADVETAKTNCQQHEGLKNVGLTTVHSQVEAVCVDGTVISFQQQKYKQ